MSQTEHREDGDPATWADPSATYDVVAGRYADVFRHELDAKPFDRDLLTRFAATVQANTVGRGLVGDLGCGPGHIGAFVADRGAAVVGIDRSAGMTAQVRRHYPALPVGQGDMGALGLRDGALVGALCFYALIHIPRATVPAVLREFRRVLVVGGSLLVAVHGGEGALHATEMLDQPVELDATLFRLAELVGCSKRAASTRWRPMSGIPTHTRSPPRDCTSGPPSVPDLPTSPLRDWPHVPPPPQSGHPGGPDR